MRHIIRVLSTLTLADLATNMGQPVNTLFCTKVAKQLWNVPGKEGEVNRCLTRCQHFKNMDCEKFIY